MQGAQNMKDILEKIFEKYFIHMIQKDWKDELKPIPEETLKPWMDDSLIGFIKNSCSEVFTEVEEELKRKYEHEIWIEINDFINEYNEKKEEAEQAEEPDEDEWDTGGDELEDDMMICTESTTECVDGEFICDHAEAHDHGPGCDTGCGHVPVHAACEKIEQEKVPDEITETGGV